MKQRIVPLLAAALALTVMLAGCSSQEEAEPLPQGMDTETVLTAGEAGLDQLLEGDYEAATAGNSRMPSPLKMTRMGNGKSPCSTVIP